ncbi:hypothetical protein ANCDUO_02741 [Ancylostoma duodenale]|uniref:Uncharacterized protein n=1 Tax=Ancylostoma duodenale TaxID=51022 RepID=A0A0C2HBR3_9BILA|nr:hypothetical protein ANCDUO_02741 [Ancylostoma duodenale]
MDREYGQTKLCRNLVPGETQMSTAGEGSPAAASARKARHSTNSKPNITALLGFRKIQIFMEDDRAGDIYNL